jgi:hypothetical protein
MRGMRWRLLFHFPQVFRWMLLVVCYGDSFG